MNNFLKIITILSLSLVFTSCSNKGVVNNNDPTLLSMSEIEQIANKHNKALEYTLSHLKNNDVNLLNDKSKVIDILNDGLNSYYNSSLNNKNEVETAVKYSKIGVERYLHKDKNAKFKADLENLSPIEILVKDESDQLSEDQIELLMMCDEILKGNSNDPSLAIEKLIDIQDLANAKLTDREALIILVGAEIAKSSVAYWDENILEWADALNNNSTAAKGWFNWSELVGADLAGGVTAAVGAAFVNTAPGVGQVAYGGAILGGAVSTSAGDAVLQVWNQVF